MGKKKFSSLIFFQEKGKVVEDEQMMEERKTMKGYKEAK